MGIAKDSIESLKLKAKISDFILSSTTGKLRGNKGMALCPFHGEKTASMSFTDEENLFHCFGCKEGGDIFKYIQLINNVEFQESVEIVAEKYAFNLRYTDSQYESNQKNLIQKLKIISDYFLENMNKSSSANPKKYLATRKIDNHDIKNFKLGYAELDEKLFYEFCETNQINKQNLQSLGLLSEKQNLLFRDRILFPITNFRNETVAFGGRALSDFGPKYLNSAESQIYKKNRTLYFTSNFLKSVKESNEIIIAEGYFDVIAFNLLGYSNAASPSGTALTVQQLEQLSKYSTNIILSFDNDTAGVNATKRILELKDSISRDLNLTCIVLPDEYKDIGEYYEKGNLNVEELIQNKVDLIEFCIDALLDEVSDNDKRKIFTEFKNLISSLGPLDQDYAFDKLSVKIDTPKDVLIKELKHKQLNKITKENLSEGEYGNQHIDSFKEIFLASLIKSNFEKIAEYKDLIESNSELYNLVEDLKTNQNSKSSESYKNISFTDAQLNEAVSRLHIHFFELKINSLISKLEESNDVKLFTEIEDLKKKIENYQNTL
ncbi:MAG: DNA primase [Actinobacteria bacterium]|nr:DNA primase [Actinomycetota bacterium]